MFILSEKRPGRVRIACVQDDRKPRDLVVIGFELDRSRPWLDPDAMYEAMQFAWQMIPDCIADSSLFALHIEVALPGPRELRLEGEPVPPTEWEPVLSKAPLATIQLVHYVLGYTRKLADRHTQQAPVVPLPTGVQRVQATLAAMLDKVSA